MDMDIRSNIRELKRGLSDFALRQMPFALSKSINETLKRLGAAAEISMIRNLHRPTRFTRRAFWYKYSSKRNLSGHIVIKPKQAEYLKYAVQGGRRRARNRALLVPVGIRLNQHGNMIRRGIGRALDNGRAFSGSPKGKPGAPGGVYQRMGVGGRTKLRLLVHYTPSADYEKRWDFKGETREKAIRLLPIRLEINLRDAIRNSNR